MTNQVDHQARQDLLQQLRSSGDPQALQKVEQLQQLYHDRELAGLGEDIYDAARGEGEPSPDWLRASEHLDKLRKYAPQLRIGDKELLDLLKPRESGFRAEIYLPDPAVLGPGYVPVVAYKGSAGMVQDANAPGGLRSTTQEDFLANNFPQSVGLQTDYYDRAMRLADSLKRNRLGDFKNVGQSLGGGLASAASAVTGTEAVTFNAAGLHPETPRRS